MRRSRPPAETLFRWTRTWQLARNSPDERLLDYDPLRWDLTPSCSSDQISFYSLFQISSQLTYNRTQGNAVPPPQMYGSTRSPILDCYNAIGKGTRPRTADHCTVFYLTYKQHLPFSVQNKISVLYVQSNCGCRAEFVTAVKSSYSATSAAVLCRCSKQLLDQW